LKTQKQNTQKLRAVALAIAALVCGVAAVYLLFFYNKDAYERQDIEESIADDFIADLIKSAIEENGKEGESDDDTNTIRIDLNIGERPEKEAGIQSVNQWRDERSEYATYKRDIWASDYGDDEYVVKQAKTYEDPNYYQRNGVTYTPDYAVGYLFCVLEYPKAGIRRGVYSGDWADIYYDLDLWMATSARPDYELGKTHMAIYGHNHTAQDLSFNNLRVASVGDEFTLYSVDGVYRYEVTRIFADWRSSVSKNYVDDMNISPDVCYIITCGRDNFLVDGQSSRYKDFVVEGHLKEVLSLTEYAEEIYGEEKSWRE
jgi:LPXTG-site transpeptidase (sortase) family protein